MDVKPPAALGPLSDWTVPQIWFGHFYALGATWNILITAVFISSSCYQSLSPISQAVYVSALVLLEIHLVRRFLETFYLMKYPSGARMHGIAYLFGITYYLAVSMAVLPDGAFSSMAEVLDNKGVQGVVDNALKEFEPPSPKLLAGFHVAVRDR